MMPFSEKLPCMLQKNSSVQVMRDLRMLLAYFKEVDGKGMHFRRLLVQSVTWKDICQTPENTPCAAFCAGGIAVTLAGHPFDTAKVRLQTQSSTNPIYCRSHT